ncbi:hypothetical protein NLM31_08610 [Bradyrhizobium sp. CCGUVB4N]|uniref:hypothetical protein n=1 Tax=Bradyrhizobium sp. CCGUVB4N TaxID=2949631 RepID=UPI0020B421FB|nr:hypothetical protein [Bradyrhizobium sp. CCGUVB4N]MCP3380424.1 hypothetical protein [Bradyrhizobium sp. CCGUVB4N]
MAAVYPKPREAEHKIAGHRALATEIVADCYIVVHDEAAPIRVMVIDVPEMGPYQGQIKLFQHVDTGRTQQRPSALLYFG